MWTRTSSLALLAGLLLPMLVPALGLCCMATESDQPDHGCCNRGDCELLAPKPGCCQDDQAAVRPVKPTESFKFEAVLSANPFELDRPALAEAQSTAPCFLPAAHHPPLDPPLRL